MTQIIPASAATILPALPGRAVTMQFNDNALLPLLLGDHDRHLSRLEKGLGVRLSCRGNRVAISGDAAGIEKAQAALTRLWQRLERGQPVGSADVDGAIRMIESGPPSDARLPLADLPAIHTKRGAVGAPVQGPGFLHRDAGPA